MKSGMPLALNKLHFCFREEKEPPRAPRLIQCTMSSDCSHEKPFLTEEKAKQTRTAVAITSEAIDVASLSSFVADDSAGAVATFVGTTRDSFQGKRTLRLDYEAYEPMSVRVMEVRCVLSEVTSVLASLESGKQFRPLPRLPPSTKLLQKICEAASARWELTAISMTHRIGTVEVGEASVAIAASSAHRRDALEVNLFFDFFHFLFFKFPGSRLGFSLSPFFSLTR